MRRRRSYTLLLILLALLVLGIFLFARMSSVLTPTDIAPTQFGITFSPLYARQLGLDPSDAYRALVENLGARRVRLPVYWTLIEPEQGQDAFALYDRLLAYSQAMNVEVTLAVGTKLPRWPECHVPAWAASGSPSEQEKAVQEMLQTVIERYRENTAVVRYQVENEPMLPFGDCLPLTEGQLRTRVEYVRRLDPTRPIQITVSGELSPWETESDLADILGISMYRLTYNDLYGYFLYPLTPDFYYARAQLVRRRVSRVVVSELQAEPWFPEPIANRPLSVWYRSFDADMLRSNIAFARDAHLSEVDLWGAEWWLLLHENGDDRLWDVAKELFSYAQNSRL